MKNALLYSRFNYQPHLHATYEMLEKAYVERIPDDELEYVAAALAPHMGFRTMTGTLNDFNDDLWSIEQLYYGYMPDYKHADPNPMAAIKATAGYMRVLARLKTCGYDTWIAEEP